MRIENPITREVLVVERTFAEGHGSAVRFTLPAHQGGPPLHEHARYDERFEVITGALRLELGAERAPRVLRAGESITVPAGTLHAFANASAAPVTFRTEVLRDPGFERFIRGWYGAAADGRSRATGPRSALELAVLIDEGDILVAGVPHALQRALRRLARWVAARTGAEQRVARWWPKAAAITSHGSST